MSEQAAAVCDARAAPAHRRSSAVTLSFVTFLNLQDKSERNDPQNPGFVRALYIEKTAAMSAPVKREKKMSTKASPFDQTRAPNNVWLVKVPQFVADAWRQMPQDSALGQLVVTQARGREPTCVYYAYSKIVILKLVAFPFLLYI